jgi:hypothetical protein
MENAGECLVYISLSDKYIACTFPWPDGRLGYISQREVYISRLPLGVPRTFLYIPAVKLYIRASKQVRAREISPCDSTAAMAMSADLAVLTAGSAFTTAGSVERAEPASRPPPRRW